jgi:hypothetical protein
MEEKTTKQLEQELQDLKASNKAAWDMYGSELCTGDMIARENALEQEILKRESIARRENKNPKQTLKLADNQFKSLRQGDKKVTVRRGRRDIRLGSLVFVGANDQTLWEEVDVVEVRYIRVSGVPDEICQQDGFDNRVDFYYGMKKHYPDLDVGEECTIIIFE